MIPTIAGFNFDSARGNGNVWLRTANDNGSYIHLDSIDYVSWNDSIIKFIMPGNGIDDDTTGSLGGAGSGIIKVQNNGGDTTLTDSTTVWYSVATAYDSISKSKLLYNLGNVYPTTNAYHFKIDTAFAESLHPDRWNAVDIAIKEWVCLSGVNFNISDTMAPPDTIEQKDLMCLIQFGTTTSRSTIAQTTRFKGNYACGGNPKVVTEEIDIVIDKNRKDSIWWDWNCHHDVPVGMYDGYAMILHELGHGHSLNHVNDSKNVMYWFDKGKQGIPANNRNTFIKFDYSASDAANYIMSKTSDPTLLVCDPSIELLHRTIPDCDSLPRVSGCGPIWVEEIRKAITDIKVFPNPANDMITLQMNSDDFCNANIEVVNIFGQTVLSKPERITMGINQISLSIANLQSGIYCIGIKTDRGRIYSQFIKQ